MKKFVLLVFMVLLFCSCEKTADVPKYPSQIPESEKLNKEETFFVSDEPENEEVGQILKMFDIDNKNLEETKISLHPEGIELSENGSFSYVLVAEKEEKTFSVPATGVIYYNGDEYAFSLDADSRIRPFWGNLAFVDENTAAFLVPGKIFLMNTTTLEAEGTIVLPESKDSVIWPAGIAFSEKTGYLVPLCEMPKGASDAKTPEESSLSMKILN